MGMDKWNARHFARLCREHGIRGSCLTLGRQGMGFDVQDMLQLLLDFGFAERVGNEVNLAPDNPLLRRHNEARARGRDYAQDNAKDPYLDAFLLPALGFDPVHTLDASAYEGATHIHDLNLPGANLAVPQRYDAILDLGTIEHIFHVPNVLQNIFSMLNVGGFVYHVLGSNSYIDHGFYQFSPTFFLDYYSANRFKIHLLQLGRCIGKLGRDPVMYFDYVPKSLEDAVVDGIGGGAFMVLALVQKTEDSVYDQIPQQGRYSAADIWQHGKQSS